jgi:hypothetical protein
MRWRLFTHRDYKIYDNNFLGLASVLINSRPRRARAADAQICGNQETGCAERQIRQDQAKLEPTRCLSGGATLSTPTFYQTFSNEETCHC